ncbi:MAG: hypothetical protein ACYSRR_02965, partial [Planctomycetota bacterium]
MLFYLRCLARAKTEKLKLCRKSKVLELFFWLRYLRKKKIVSLSIAAVALSCGLLIVVSSMFSGFIETYQRSAIETIGQVVV